MNNDNPICECCGVPKRWDKDARRAAGGFWRCRTRAARYNASPKGKARNAHYDASPKGKARNAHVESRRVRIYAGGIGFDVGYAPTSEAAAIIRDKIKKEAPHALRHP